MKRTFRQIAGIAAGLLLLASWNSQAVAPVIFPLDIKFDTDKATIKPGAHNDQEFKKLTDELKNYPYSMVEIEGYTDSSGSSASNQKLSEERAEAVRQRIIQRGGIASNRIKAVGFGETKPAVSNSKAAGRTQNRRVIARIIRIESEKTPSNGNHI
jgi:outer membrane protein OmpA-like peptidoglycan-associated protein